MTQESSLDASLSKTISPRFVITRDEANLKRTFPLFPSTARIPTTQVMQWFGLWSAEQFKN